MAPSISSTSQPSKGPSREEAKKHQKILQALASGNLTIVIGAGVTMGAIECSTLDYTDKEKKDKAANLRWGALILDGIKYLEKECEAHFEESERQELRCYKEILGHKNAEDTENSGKSGKATALPSLLRAAAFLRTKLVNCHRLPDWLELQFCDLYDEYIGQDKENG